MRVPRNLHLVVLYAAVLGLWACASSEAKRGADSGHNSYAPGFFESIWGSVAHFFSGVVQYLGDAAVGAAIGFAAGVAWTIGAIAGFAGGAMHEITSPPRSNTYSGNQGASMFTTGFWAIVGFCFFIRLRHPLLKRWPKAEAAADFIARLVVGPSQSPAAVKKTVERAGLAIAKPGA